MAQADAPRIVVVTREGFPLAVQQSQPPFAGTYPNAVPGIHEDDTDVVILEAAAVERVMAEDLEAVTIEAVQPPAGGQPEVALAVLGQVVDGGGLHSGGISVVGKVELRPLGTEARQTQQDPSDEDGDDRLHSSVDKRKKVVNSVGHEPLNLTMGSIVNASVAPRYRFLR